MAEFICTQKSANKRTCFFRTFFYFTDFFLAFFSRISGFGENKFRVFGTEAFSNIPFPSIFSLIPNRGIGILNPVKNSWENPEKKPKHIFVSYQQEMLDILSKKIPRF